MKELTFTPMTQDNSGIWIKSEQITIDITSGVNIVPHDCGKESGHDDSGSHIKRFIVDPKKGIVGEEEFFAFEPPVELIKQL